MMARKALLVIAFTMWSRSIALKIELAAVIIVVSLYCHKSYYPMLIKQLDKMEGITLLANALVLIAGLGVFVSDGDGGDATAGSQTVAFVIFAIFVCICLIILIWILLFLYNYNDTVEYEADKVMAGEVQQDMMYIDDDKSMVCMMMVNMNMMMAGRCHRDCRIGIELNFKVCHFSEVNKQLLIKRCCDVI